MVNNNRNYNSKRKQNTVRKNLRQMQIRANGRHLDMLDELAEYRGTTRTQLIREGIFQLLIRELKHEQNRQLGMRDAKARLNQLMNRW